MFINLNLNIERPYKYILGSLRHKAIIIHDKMAVSIYVNEAFRDNPHHKYLLSDKLRKAYDLIYELC